MTSLAKSLRVQNGTPATNDLEADSGSARRLLRVLMSFSSADPLVTAEQLAHRTGLPLSSTYRYLNMLREVGLVGERGRNGFYIGPASNRLFQAARAANPFERIARPFVRHLSCDSQETVVLLRRMHDKAICIDGVEAPCVVRTPVKIGCSVPLHIGAAPKLLLATLPEPTRSQVLKQCAVRYKLDNAQKESLEAEFESIDKSGWAACYGGVFPDVFAVAAPIRGERAVIASLAIVAPIFRVTTTTSESLRVRVVAAANELSAALSDDQAGIA